MWLSVEQVENHYVSQLMITHFTDVFVSAKWLVCFIRKQRSRHHTHHSCWCTAHGICHCQPSIKPTCTVNNNNPASAGHVCMRNPWWRHLMETFSASLTLCAGYSPVTVNSTHTGQWHGALMFSSICAGINGWVNNREAGDLRRHRARCDVTVMPKLNTVPVDGPAANGAKPSTAIHYSDVTMSAMASQITSVRSVQSTVCSGSDQRKHQSSALLAFVRGIHRWPVNSHHKGPVTRKMFPFDDVMMYRGRYDLFNVI